MVQTLPDDLSWYRVHVFGLPTIAFPVDSVFGFVIFHGLVWSSFLVIAGVMLAMRRRMRDHGAAALQHFGEDFLPLILLFAISVTGLMLTASYTWMRGYAYDFILGAASRNLGRRRPEIVCIMHAAGSRRCCCKGQRGTATALNHESWLIS